MKLYRGSREKSEVITAQALHPVDIPKFGERVPSHVIWATQHVAVAWVFGIFWQRESIRVFTKQDGSNVANTVHEIHIARELYPEELIQPVYLYTLPGDGFSYLHESDEWYSLEESLPASVETCRIDAVLNELITSGVITVRVHPEIAFPPMTQSVFVPQCL